MISGSISKLTRTAGASRCTLRAVSTTVTRRLVSTTATRVLAARVAAGAGNCSSLPLAPRSALLQPPYTSATLRHSIRLFSSESYPPHVVINMPALSPTMTQGNIGTWKKQPGDEVAPGDVLVEIETDKAQMDFECQEEGYIAKILVESGTKDVDIRTPIAVLVENKDDVAKFADFKPEAVSAPAAPAPSEAAAAKEETAPSSEASAASSATASSAPSRITSTDFIKASPLAKSLALEHGLSLKGVNGTGPGGRIVKADIEKLLASGTASAGVNAAASGTAAAAAAFEDIPLSNMRKVIAKRLTEAKQQVPHYYLTVEARMDKIIKLRQAFNQTSDGKYRLSVNDFVIKASALALQAVPEVNSAWQGESIRRYASADICVATATPTGLITPIVPSANTKGLSEISNQVKELARKARNNELMPHEYQGGTFTISNLGMYDIQSFTAIINPPQSCILAVGSTEQKLVPAATDKGFEVHNVMKVTLSCDHRVVDGAVGAQWLQAWKRFMENPVTMML